MITPVDYEAEARKLVITQFYGQKNFEKLLAVFTAYAQTVEGAALSILSHTAIDDAEGATLDLIGQQVGQPRDRRGDPAYRIWIKFRIFINISNGEHETQITAIRFLTEATRVRYRPNHPAGYEIETDGVSLPDGIAEILQGLAPSGISNVSILYFMGEEKPFRYAELPPPVPWLDAQGFPILDDSDNPIVVPGSAGDLRLEGSRFSELIGAPFLDDGDEPITASNGSPVLLGVGSHPHPMPHELLQSGAIAYGIGEVLQSKGAND